MKTKKVIIYHAGRRYVGASVGEVVNQIKGEL
jgi:hypothetical protein